MIEAKDKKHAHTLARLKGNALLFGKVCFPTMFSVKSAPFHYQINDDYHSKAKKICWVAPRGSAKSSLIGCIFPLHHIFFDDGPKFVVLASKTQGHAILLLRTIKHALNYNEELAKVVGYWGEFSAKKWGEAEIILKDGTIITTRGTGQMIIGMKEVHQRPTLILVDDPEDDKNTKTKEALENNLKWLLAGVEPCLDVQRGRLFAIGTPQHERCIVNMIGYGAKDKSTMEGWVYRIYRMTVSEREKITCWPEMFSWAWRCEKRASFESIHRLAFYLREWECTIVNSETATVHDDDIQYYDGKPEYLNGEWYITMKKELRIPVNVFIGVDPATSEEEAADYFVIMVVACDRDWNFYILTYTHAHFAPSTAIQEMLKKIKEWKPKRFTIETSGQQDIYRDILYKLEGVFVPGLSMKNNPQDKKEKRYLDLLQPYFAKKKIHFLAEQHEMVDELLTLGNSPEHDDFADGLYWAIKNAFKPYHSIPLVTMNDNRLLGASVEDDWSTS